MGKSLFSIVGCLLISISSSRATSVGPWNIVTTYAGTGVVGFSGDGGAATAAQFDNPQRIALDSSDNLYIVDTNNQRVRKIDKTTLNISTVIGTGNTAFNGHNTALTTNLNYPSSIRLDSNGNKYLTDYGFKIIRKIDTAGNVTLFAGVLVTNGYNGDNILANIARLNNPIDTYINAAGDVYIADFFNHSIRKVDHTTGLISTVAGTRTGNYNGDNQLATVANLQLPAHSFIDSSGDLIITDTYNNRIRKVDHVTGMITTIAGTGTLGYNSDNVAPTAARLNVPQCTLQDSLGNLFIADGDNNRVRKIDQLTGKIITIFGNGTATSTGDNGAAFDATTRYTSGLAVDSQKNLYVVEYFNNKIRKIDARKVNITSNTGYITLEGNTQYNSIQGIAGSQINTNTYTLTFGDSGGGNYSSTFSGNITGSGGLTLYAGTGTFTVNGTQSYTGATTINAGTLAINGSLQSSNVVITTNGTLTISTNYTNNAGNLTVAIKPASSPSIGDYSKISVGNIADINGTTLNVNTANGTYTQGATYPILTAANVTGSFTNESSLPTVGIYQLKLVKSLTGISIVADRTIAASASLPPSSTQLLDYLNEIPADGNAELTSVITTLQSLPSSSIPPVLVSMNPQRNTNTGETSINHTPLINSINGLRTAELRNFDTSANVSPISFNSVQQTTFLPLAQMVQGSKPNALNGFKTTLGGLQSEAQNSIASQTAFTKGNGGMWLHTFGQLAVQDDKDDQPGFKAQTAGALVGIDQKMASNCYLGGIIAYSHSLLNANNNNGNSRLSAYYTALYSTWYNQNWNIDASIVAALNSYNNNRYINIPGNERVAHSDHYGYELTPHFSFSYNFQLKPLNISPFISFDYVMLKERAYTEKGAGVLNHRIEAKFSSLLKTEVGFNIFQDYKFDDKVLRLSAKASYVNKRPHNVNKMSASFTGQNMSFTIQDSNKTQHHFAPAIEANIKYKNGNYLALRFDGEYTKGRHSNELMLKVGHRF